MNKFWLLFSVSFFLFLCGCETTPVKHPGITPFRKPITLSTSTEEEETKPWESEISRKIGEKKEKGSVVQDEFTYPVAYEKPRHSFSKPEYAGEKIDIAFNFDNAEIKDILHVLLGEILNVNYILDNRVVGKINLHATGQVYKEELLTMLNTLLNVYNFAILKEGDIYRVLPKPEARQESTTVIVGDKIPPWGKDIVTQIVPLKYESARNLQTTLRPLMTSIGNIVTHGDAQFIILIDNASTMEKLLALITTLDIPFFAGKSVKFYELKYADARNVAKDLAAFAQSLGGKIGAEGGFNFIPFTDTNKMLVVTRIPELLPKIDVWLKNIDVPPTATDEELKIYVYKMQHQKAETLAPVLTQLYTEKMAAIPKVQGKEQAEAMKIVADPKTNALVVKALPMDYRNIKSIIEAIDATPQQVFIEVLIVEVSLADTLDYGAEWQWNMGNLKLGGLPLGKDETGNITGFGSPYIFSNKGNVDILMNILATNSNAKILSAPHILVRDEQPASIQVGSQVPIRSSSGQQTGTTVTFEQVQYRDTGIILTVTPHIAENDFVTLDIKQEVSNAEETTTAKIDSPTFSTRKAETSLMIKSGHSISLGGIIEHKDEKSVSKIPLLGDIPFLGNLFKSTSIKSKRTELIMLITPYIANNAEEADILTNTFQKKLKELEPFLNYREDAIE